MNAIKPDITMSAQYSWKEACAIVGVNRTTLWRWAKRGYITVRHRKINGSAYIEGRELSKLWGN